MDHSVHTFATVLLPQCSQVHRRFANKFSRSCLLIVYLERKFAVCHSIATNQSFNT